MVISGVGFEIILNTDAAASAFPSLPLPLFLTLSSPTAHVCFV
jgi:hypothetical protein